MAEKLVPGNTEMIFWHAVALVNMGRIQQSIPLFRRTFESDYNWRALVLRLPAAGLLPDDPKVLEQISSKPH